MGIFFKLTYAGRQCIGVFRFHFGGRPVVVVSGAFHGYGAVVVGAVENEVGIISFGVALDKNGSGRVVHEFEVRIGLVDRGVQAVAVRGGVVGNGIRMVGTGCNGQAGVERRTEHGGRHLANSTAVFGNGFIAFNDEFREPAVGGINMAHERGERKLRVLFYNRAVE